MLRQDKKRQARKVHLPPFAFRHTLASACLAGAFLGHLPAALAQNAQHSTAAPRPAPSHVQTQRSYASPQNHAAPVPGGQRTYPPQTGNVSRPGNAPAGRVPYSGAPAYYGGNQAPYAGNAGSGPPANRRPLITAQPQANGAPAPGFNPNRVPYRAPASRPGYVFNSTSGSQSNQHLGSWLATHHGESFQDQQRSLEREPGFNRLPEPQQQRLLNHLQQLNSMPPAQRQRTLDRIENMERLSPERRQSVRSAAQQLAQMPPQRKLQVQQAFRDLRDLPPAERQNRLNSPEFRGQYSDGERNILGNLLSVEPYEGPQSAAPR